MSHETERAFALMRRLEQPLGGNALQSSVLVEPVIAGAAQVVDSDTVVAKASVIDGQLELDTPNGGAVSLPLTQESGESRASSGQPDKQEEQLESNEVSILTPEMQSFKDVFEGMDWELKGIASQLKPAIEQGTYTSILGEDVSGHYPALFVYRLMERYSEDCGTSPPNIIFVAPSKPLNNEHADEKDANLKTYLNESKGKLGKKTLIVSEFTATGDSLASLTSNLPGEVDADVAVLVEGPYIDQEIKKRIVGENGVFYSAWEDKQPQLYEQKRATGLVKNDIDPVAHTSEDYDHNLVDFAHNVVLAKADEVYDEMFHGQASTSYDEFY